MTRQFPLVLLLLAASAGGCRLGAPSAPVDAVVPPREVAPPPAGSTRTATAVERGLPCLLDVPLTGPSEVHQVRLTKDGFSVALSNNHGADNGEFNGLTEFQLPSRDYGVLFHAWNFEHVFDGVQHENNADPATARIFEPRQAKAVMDLVVHSESAATLRLRPTPFWGVEAATRFEVVDGQTIDIGFSARLTRKTPQSDWFGLFWASYPSAGRGLPIWFPGRAEAGLPTRWIRGDASNHLEANTWIHERSPAPISFVDDYPHKLFTTSAEASELVSETVFYARLPEQLTFVTMLDGGPSVRLTQSPVSAWDAQWVVHGWEVGSCYSMRARLILDEKITPDEVLVAYAKWMDRPALKLPAP